MESSAMKAAYLIGPDEQSSNAMARGDIDATRSLYLPGIECPMCDDAWAISGLEYPTIDSAPLRGAVSGRSSWPVPPTRFREIGDIIRPMVPSHVVVAPGTAFGPLVRARVKSKFAHFGWLFPWTLLVTSATLACLRRNGINLRTRLIELKKPNHAGAEVFEVEARPSVNCIDRRPTKVCEICGRQDFTTPSRIVIDRASFDPLIPIQRLIDWPTMLVINKVFAEVISIHELSGVEVTPLISA